MSLINEMLSDLAKNKKVVDAKPISLDSIDNKSGAYNVKVFLFRAFYGFIFINLVVISFLYIYKYKTVSQLNITSQEKKYNSVIPSIAKAKFKLKSINHLIAKTKVKDIDKVKSISNLVINDSNLKKSFFIKKYKPLSKRQYSRQKYKKAMYLSEQGESNKIIIKILISVLEKDPTFIDARQTLASLLVDLNKLKQAHEVIDKGLSIQPNNLGLIEIKAQLLLSKHQPQQALVLLKKNTPLITDEPDYYNLMAVALEQTGQLASSGAIYQQLIQIQPSNGAYWFGLALSLEAKSQMNQAIGAYQNVIGAYNSSPIIISYAKERITALG